MTEGHDAIHGIELSGNGQYLLAFTHEGVLDGTPMIYIWEASTLKKRAQISINQPQLHSVHFSSLSTMLLVLSSTREEEDPVSVMAVWDFLGDCVECLCRT